MIAFLGMGHLGANFTKALTGKGHEVNIWNRTPVKAKALEAFGAKAFDKVTDAVKGASIVHLVLKDDSAVDEVLAMARPGLEPGATIIDHTTTSVRGAVDRIRKWKEEGFDYLHVPVFMAPQNALESTGNMLVSGDQELIGRVRDHLATMTGNVINFGTEPGKAAGMKLIGNLFLMAITGGIADMLSLAKASGITTGDLTTLIDAWNPGTSVPARLHKMTKGEFNRPSWELSMARKDAGLMINEAELGGSPLALVPAIAAEMDRWIDRGHGSDDWTVIGKDHLSS